MSPALATRAQDDNTVAFSSLASRLSPLASRLPPSLDSRRVAHDPYAALRVQNFRRFIVSLLAMTIGAQIQGVVVAWQVYDVTHDPLSLGLMGLAEALPFIGLSLYAGHVADRANRRTIALAWLAVMLDR